MSVSSTTKVRYKSPSGEDVIITKGEPLWSTALMIATEWWDDEQQMWIEITGSDI